MSRYQTEGKKPSTTVVFGFDRPLSQYFVDVIRKGKGEHAVVGPLSTVYGNNTNAFAAIERLADLDKLNANPELREALSRLCGDLPC